MSDRPFRYDFKQVLGSAVDGSIARAKASARGAVQAGGLALHGRRLTQGELHMIAVMFGTTRGFAAARVFAYNYWWPSSFDRAMTPSGAIYFPSPDYYDDFSSAVVPVRLRALFMHEATHFYQWYVLGQWVIVRGPFDRNYQYELKPGKPLKDYGLEQMGQIVEDFYNLQHGARGKGFRFNISDYRNAVPVKAK